MKKDQNDSVERNLAGLLTKLLIMAGAVRLKAGAARNIIQVSHMGRRGSDTYTYFTRKQGLRSTSWTLDYL